MMHENDKLLRIFQADFEWYCNRIHNWKPEVKRYGEMAEKEKEKLKFDYMIKQIPKLQ